MVGHIQQKFWYLKDYKKTLKFTVLEICEKLHDNVYVILKISNISNFDPNFCAGFFI